MSKGTAPLFSTAPRIQIKIGDVDIAYAIGLNLNVSVHIQPIRIVGQFGPVSLEPTRYNPVTGTMQIIRLASSENIKAQQAASQALAVNGLYTDTELVESKTKDESGKEKTELVDTLITENKDGQILSQKGLYQHMDPAEVLVSRAFNVDLYMRVPNTANENVQTSLGATETVKPGEPQNLYTTVPWLRIINCRITSRNVNIAQGQLVNEPVSFQGLMATPLDDSTNNLFTLDSSNAQT